MGPAGVGKTKVSLFLIVILILRINYNKIYTSYLNYFKFAYKLLYLIIIKVITIK